MDKRKGEKRCRQKNKLKHPKSSKLGLPCLLNFTTVLERLLKGQTLPALVFLENSSSTILPKKRTMTEFKRRRQKRDLSGMLEHPKPGPPITHGAHSKEVQAKYSDLRTKQGQKLAAVVNGLIQDLGGVENVSTAQNILIGNIKSKLIVIFQIGDYADKQKTILDQGVLMPCLGQNFLSYGESLRRDLKALCEIAKTKPPKVPSIKDIVSEHEANGK